MKLIASGGDKVIEVQNTKLEYRLSSYHEMIIRSQQRNQLSEISIFVECRVEHITSNSEYECPLYLLAIAHKTIIF